MAAGTAAQYQAAYLTPPTAVPTDLRFGLGGAHYTLTSLMAAGHSVSVAQGAVAATPRHVAALAAASTAIGYENARADFVAITGP